MTLLDLQILGAAALIFVPLERLLPLHPGQQTLRATLRTDFLHLFVSGFLIRTGAAAITLLLSLAAISIVPAEFRALVRGQPVWLQFLELLILADLGFYLAHRTVHSVPLLWRFHAVHHSSEQMDWVATYRVHPVDQIFNSMVIALPGIALGVGPEALVIYALLYRWHAMLLHSNVNIRFGWLEKVIASPRFHHWHHADEPQAYDTNFGGQLVLWDSLFGTRYKSRSLPVKYGCTDMIPEGYCGQLASPFRGSDTDARTPLIANGPA